MTISRWIKDREVTGYTTFSIDDVVAAFPLLDIQQIKNTLYRLAQSRDVASVYKGFYVIIPPHYKKKGVVHPSYYINQLMRHLHKPYYVGLLNAAEIFGAAHQRPQTYTVVTTLPKASTSLVKNPILRWIYITRIPEQLLIAKNSETSSVKYSCAELTALDLVQHASRAGGLSRAATVLAELCETTDFGKLNNTFLESIKLPTFQRLGFILDEILEQHDQAEKIHQFITSTGRRLHYVKLSNKNPHLIPSPSRRWNINVNTQIELDDL